MMNLGFVPARRAGQHWDLAKFALSKLRKANLLKKAKSERACEQGIVGYLEGSPKLKKQIITQVQDESVEKVTPALLFSFKNRPDVTIGNDGTALEVKVVKKADGLRQLLGQSLSYRTHYRFVIQILIDRTEGRKIVELCSDKKSAEYAMLRGLATGLNIFTVVGPVTDKMNLVFAP